MQLADTEKPVYDNDRKAIQLLVGILRKPKGNALAGQVVPGRFDARDEIPDNKGRSSKQVSECGQLT